MLYKTFIPPNQLIHNINIKENLSHCQALKVESLN
jgi:hypothetical protein